MRIKFDSGNGDGAPDVVYEEMDYGYFEASDRNFDWKDGLLDLMLEYESGIV